MTSRQRWFVVMLGAGCVLLVLALVAALVIRAVRDDDPAAAQIPTPSVSMRTLPIPTGSAGQVTRTPGQLPAGVVPNLWPVDRARAEQVTGYFAIAFSNYQPTGPKAPGEWVRSLAPYATQRYLRLAAQRFNQFWWYLTSGGLGASDARLVSVTPIWQRTESMMFRVVLDRQVRSYLGQEERNHAERVSWDIIVVGAERDRPLVVSCLKADPRQDGLLPEGEPADVG